MAKPRAILKRAQAVKNIAKITSTMQMIATARFKKAHDRAVAARPYTDRLTRLIEDVSGEAGDIEHPLLEVRPGRRVVVLAIASNRGLCGGYNTGVARATMDLRAAIAGEAAEVSTTVSGKRVAGMLRFRQVPIARVVTHIDDRPRFEDVDALLTPWMDAFTSGRVDALYVAYTRFLSSARQQPVAERILPLARPAGEEVVRRHRSWLFSPDPQSILADLLPLSVRLQVFQAFLDAAVAEQTARMVAMKNATDNAEDLIRALTQKYNRSRQALITTELTEIMGGAAALE